jgi:hypothetical protein
MDGHALWYLREPLKTNAQQQSVSRISVVAVLSLSSGSKVFRTRPFSALPDNSPLPKNSSPFSIGYARNAAEQNDNK